MATRRRGYTDRAMPRRLLGALLILLMAVGSVLLWIGIPVGWLYLASQLVDSPQPSMGPYVLVLVGIPATMIAMGKVLAILDRDLRPRDRHRRRRASRRRGTARCAATARRRGARSVLDVVMVAAWRSPSSASPSGSSCSPDRACRR